MYTILGATGNIGGKIAGILAKEGKTARIVARSADRLKQLAGKHAEAFVGDALDTEFLVKAFTGAEAIFTLIPPNFKAEKFLTYADTVGESIARAVEIAEIKYVVNLSSVGADLPDGTGPIVGLHRQEERLNRIKGLQVLHLRPAYFMENLLMNVDLIKTKGIAGSAIRGENKFPMIATKDIAAFAAERLVKRDFSGSSVKYLLGQRDLSMIEATMTIGGKIGLPDLPYITFPYDAAEKGLIAAGLSADMSRLYLEMSRAFNEGRVIAVRTTANTTSTTMEEFCDEVFTPAYRQLKVA